MTVAVRERPILFSAPMVCAILAGRKTQTRRVVTPLPPDGIRGVKVEWFAPGVVSKHGDLVEGLDMFGAYDEDGEWGMRCPYSAPSDRLWVRETFSVEWDEIHYKAGGASEWDEGSPHAKDAQRMFDTQRGEWRPSIFMPRWASRITLAVEGVRVERLQSITEADAMAEGLGHGTYTAEFKEVARPEYRALWDLLNAKRGHGWDTNPWVWVVTFRREQL